MKSESVTGQSHDRMSVSLVGCFVSPKIITKIITRTTQYSVKISHVYIHTAQLTRHARGSDGGRALLRTVRSKGCDKDKDCIW